jgi:hypothetical protein
MIKNNFYFKKCLPLSPHCVQAATVHLATPLPALNFLVDATVTGPESEYERKKLLGYQKTIFVVETRRCNVPGIDVMI